MRYFTNKTIKSIQRFSSTSAFLAVVGLCSLVLSLFLWNAQKAKNFSQLSLQTASKARSYASETEIRYTHIYNALNRLASTGAPCNQTRADKWEKDAALYLEIFREIQSIAWIDNNLRIQRIVSLDDRRSLLNQTANDMARSPSDLQLWMACTDRVAFNGYLLNTISIIQLVRPIVDEIENDYMLQVAREGLTMFRSDNWESVREELVVHRTIMLKDAGRVWFSLAPTNELIKTETGYARRTLFLSLFLSGITLAAVYAAQSLKTSAFVSELRYRHLFGASQDAIFVIDQKGRFQDANPSATAMLGYSLDELQHMTVETVCEQSRPDACLPLWTEGGMHEIRLRRKNGTTIPVDLMFSPVKHGGTRKYVLGIARDITERKQAEAQINAYSENLAELVAERTRELREAQAQLLNQERLTVLGKLAGSMSHELRNPLGVISNSIYFLQTILPDATGSVENYLNIMEAEVRKASGIINELLEYARVQTASRQVIPVHDLVQDVFTGHAIPEKVTLGLDIPEKLPPVCVDPGQIRQILNHLVTNACQAMPDGGTLTVGSRQCAVSSQQVAGNRHPDEDSSLPTADCLLLTVQDTGCGIAPEYMDQLFEPLFTTKTCGLGLGLATCQKLAEVNGGRIEVESVPGNGSTFTLTLPAFLEKKQDD